ncbi:sensor histidine kinase [Microcoleus sp. A003_D6]|uniref:sensor histidine kinase n=1 Tax=Microcoleus sp. A003_D6 TaxID=3055266 RepID=UPI002FD4E6A3
MSSLGQLVAVVAHEINNPVNFIHGNLRYLEEYSQNLLNIVQLYQHHYPNAVAEIQVQEDAIDLYFLQKYLVKILNSMKFGTERIRNILLSLRNFSRTDEVDIKPVNIHEGLDSTLMILQHRLKASSERPSIEVIKDYASLAIADNGSGIPKEIGQRIFDPFFTTKPVGKGTGMGMSIGYQIVTEKHGGKLECFSTQGEGTEFAIKIPVRQKFDRAS